MSTEAGNQAWTILRLLNWTKDYLHGKGVDQPRLAAEMLLAHVLGCRRLELYTQFDRVPSPEAMASYRELVRRAAAREPIAYLVGHREFYSLELLVTPEVLVPRPETELLAQRAMDFLKAHAPAGRYWDACTGSGAVPVAVGRHVPGVSILATDLSEPALEVARRNFQKHALTERATLAKVDLLALPESLSERAPFDAITANPPYLSDAQLAAAEPEVRAEPEMALRGGPEGLDAIGPILRQAPPLLRPGGLLAMEIGYGQAASVWDIANGVARYERLEFARDMAGIERVLIAYRAAD